MDSGGFGRLISKMRAQPSLQQVDLQMLFEHPTVRSLSRALVVLPCGFSDGFGILLKPAKNKKVTFITIGLLGH